MDNPEKLSGLFFELSNVDRFRIILELESNSSKLSHIAKKLNLTVQETSRNLTRLSKVKLVAKQPTGDYQLTPFCRHILSLVPAIKFIVDNDEYFSAHSISMIPEHLLFGMGRLGGSEFTGHVMESFQQTESLIADAKEYIWIMSDQVLSSTLPLIEDAVKRGLEFKLVLPNKLFPLDLPPSSFREIDHTGHHAIHQRGLEKVEIVVIMSENEALVSFPAIDGQMDYLGFSVIQEESHVWCQEVFQFFWDKAMPQ